MVFVGLLVTLAGFLLSVMSLGMSDSVGGRLVFVLAGIVVSIIGITLINKHYLKSAIWKRS